MSKVQSNNRDTGLIDEFTIAGEGSAVLSGTYKMQLDKRHSGCIADLVAFASPPTANLFGWWNASNAYTDDGTTLCSNSGVDVCKQLTDLSGNSRHLTQITAGYRPTWYSSQLNSFPSVRFDGSDDRIVKTSIAQAQPLTVVWVWKQSVFNDNQCWALQANNDAYVKSSNSKLRVASSFDDGTTLSINTFYMGFIVLNGASSLSKINNSADTTGSTGTDALDKVNLGCNNGESGFMTGDVCEMMIYSSAYASTSGEGLQIRRYLNSKYNLGLTL